MDKKLSRGGFVFTDELTHLLLCRGHVQCTPCSKNSGHATRANIGNHDVTFYSGPIDAMSVKFCHIWFFAFLVTIPPTYVAIIITKFTILTIAL